MKIKSLIIAMAIATSAFAGTPNQFEYKVNNQSSKLTWVGRKVVGEHTGTINLADGKLLTDGKTLTGGSFEIDMGSIANSDLTDKEYNQKLVGHLKSEDFFSSSKFPKSTLVITKVTSSGKNNYLVKGNLTIKGITHPVEFPATVSVADKKIEGNAKIMVDRTKYDIRYGSGSFFDNLGDKAINNEFELNIQLVATK
jgi:polyisoprenoid-binding protein YceI